MNKNNHILNCRVCGLDQGFKPWGADGETPSFDICDCCGLTFGYQDCQISAIRKHRSQWLENEARWHCPKEKPENWSLEEQMKNIPEEFS